MAVIRAEEAEEHEEQVKQLESAIETCDEALATIGNTTLVQRALGLRKTLLGLTSISLSPGTAQVRRVLSGIRDDLAEQLQSTKDKEESQLATYTELRQTKLETIDELEAQVEAHTAQAVSESGKHADAKA